MNQSMITKIEARQIDKNPIFARTKKKKMFHTPVEAPKHSFHRRERTNSAHTHQTTPSSPSTPPDPAQNTKKSNGKLAGSGSDPSNPPPPSVIPRGSRQGHRTPPISGPRKHKAGGKMKSSKLSGEIGRRDLHRHWGARAMSGQGRAVEEVPGRSGGGGSGSGGSGGGGGEIGQIFRRGKGGDDGLL